MATSGDCAGRPDPTATGAPVRRSPKPQTLVVYGRSRSGRQALARAIGHEPTLAQPWLRTLVTGLNSGG
ncbi:MAG TPA: hypothetical protein VFM55_11980 [Micromonosporaceae bacterium]|nr:hypothetical protein [Micromonosporaceae bacterium]